jgi:hypothetical protein
MPVLVSIMECHCKEYLNPIKTSKDIQARCEASSAVSMTLVEVASDFTSWMSVSQCKVCQRYWAKEYYLGEKRGNDTECFYHIQCEYPQQWLKDHKGQLRWLKDRKSGINGE